MYTILNNYQKEIMRCVKCGLCRVSCPVFEELLNESTVARGKISLIEAVLENRLELSRIFIDCINLCINCKSCVLNCPSGVRVDHLILSTRAELVNRGKWSFLKRLFFRQLLKRGRLLPPVSRWCSLFQQLLFHTLPQYNTFRLVLPVSGIPKHRNLPVFAKRSLRKSIPSKLTPAKRRYSVGYFIGCAVDFIYPSIGFATVEVLRKNDIEVIIPVAQQCCGMPVLNAGDFLTARTLAMNNIRVFESAGIDTVIVSCASCGLSWKSYYSDLLNVTPSFKIYDISEFLIDIIDFKPPRTKYKKKISYHDPCHLNRGQNIYSQPRKLLKSIPGIELIEMEQSDRCCGSGGMFSLNYYDLSIKITKQKLRSILTTNAELIATGCPSCIMQLTDALIQQQLSQYQPIHTIQILADAYRSTNYC